MKLCVACEHPNNSHSPDTGHCNVARDGVVCDCPRGRGETIIGYIDPDGSGDGDWFTSFREDAS